MWAANGWATPHAGRRGRAVSPRVAGRGRRSAIVPESVARSAEGSALGRTAPAFTGSFAQLFTPVQARQEVRQHLELAQGVRTQVLEEAGVEHAHQGRVQEGGGQNHAVAGGV